MATRLGITSKLFLGVLATSALAALVLAITGKVRFQSDFREYVEAGENYRIESLAETLASIYADTGDWSVLEAADRRWHALLRSTPRMDESRFDAIRIGPERGWPHVALYDTDDHPIVGYVGAGGDSARHPVTVDGRIVGWIARQRWTGPTDRADLAFQRAQLLNFLVATLAAVLAAAIAAALLARVFLAPARSIGAATHRLTAGDFDVRVAVRRQDEFGRLADDFNVLAQTLQRNEEMRRRMMADVAHELRTPLAVIQGELAAIEDGIRPLNSEALASLRDESRALGKLIDDLYQLSLSDLGALDYRRRDIDLRSELSTLLRPLHERCAARGLALDDSGIAGEPLMVHADPDRLAQLINNLVENSMRYTDVPGQIVIACRQAQGKAILELSDSPPGLPTEDFPRMFERFYRAEPSRCRVSGGAGLGLAICRNIVEAHDGTIAASPSKLGGVTITISLPLLRSIS
jgi:two-component system, OmpR family, sensor histidine kinase BaeS